MGDVPFLIGKLRGRRSWQTAYAASVCGSRFEPMRSVPYLISPASLGSVRLISGTQMISSSPVNSASMYGT
jgi:hypothetical protein